MKDFKSLVSTNHVLSTKLLGGSPHPVHCYSISASNPLDCYMTLFCDRECDWEAYLALSCIHTQVGLLNHLALNHLGSSTARLLL